MQHDRPLRLVAAVLLAASSTLAVAAEWGSAMRDAGDYTIYYNAVPANELDVWVADTYGLPKGSQHCIVTIAVVDKESGDSLPAQITASATRSDGRMHQLDMRPISDSGGVYYIAELPIDSATTMDFTFRVQPGRGLPPQTVRFKRQFSGD